jgi:uncharacterized protein (DUF2384 family)
MASPGVLPTELNDLKNRIQAALDAQGDVPPGFDLDSWLREWLERPQPALGGARPMDLLSTPEGLESVRRALGAVVSNAYQ